MQIAETIPHFRAPASTGQTLEWSSYRDKAKVVLAFLPGAAGDRDELQAFNDLHADFGRRTVQVLAVAPMTASDARALAGQMDLTVPILADPANQIARQAGAFDDGNHRVTAAYGESGKLIGQVAEAEPSEHASQILEVVTSTQQA